VGVLTLAGGFCWIVALALSGVDGEDGWSEAMRFDVRLLEGCCFNLCPLWSSALENPSMVGLFVVWRTESWLCTFVIGAGSTRAVAWVALGGSPFEMGAWALDLLFAFVIFGSKKSEERGKQLIILTCKKLFYFFSQLKW
jgi:hypothetical protein